jgi:hypothetical protein
MPMSPLPKSTPLLDESEEDFLHAFSTNADAMDSEPALMRKSLREFGEDSKVSPAPLLIGFDFVCITCFLLVNNGIVFLKRQQGSLTACTTLTILL